MCRTETKIREYRSCGSVEYAVVEVYTHRVDAAGGVVLRSDRDGLWFDGRNSWRGREPQGWDWSKAVAEHFERRFEYEVDYS